MLSRGRREAERIERYWLNLRRPGDKPPVLDEGLGEFIAEVDAGLRPPAADDEFVNRLWQALDASGAGATSPRAGRTRADSAPTPDTWPRERLNGHQPTQPEPREIDHHRARPVRSRRRRFVAEGLKLAAAALAFTIVGAVLALTLRGGRVEGPAGPGPSPTVVSSAVTTPSAPAPTTTTIVIGRFPFGPAANAGAIWVPNEGDGTLSRIDPATNEVVATIDLRANHGVELGSHNLVVDLPEMPVAVAASETAVWVTRYSGASPNEHVQELLRINPATNAIVATIPLPVAPYGLALSDDALWVLSRAANEVLRIDMTTSQIVARIPVRLPVTAVVGDGALWVVTGGVVDASGQRMLIRIDLATNAIVDTLPVPGTVDFIAVGAGAMWIPDAQSKEILRVDPVSHAIVARIRVIEPDYATFVGGDVWVSSGALHTLTRIDAETNAVVATYPGGDRGSTLVVADGVVWIADGGHARIIRVDP